jgi:hypothetical protein
MKQNMGTADRVIRTLIVLLIGVLYFTETISGTVALILGLLAIVFLLTSIIGFCPLYTPLKISTRKKV